MDGSTPGFSVPHHLPEFAHVHVHCISDTIHPSHPYCSLLLSSIFPSIKVFSNESALHIRWPKYWRFSISPSNEYSRLISFQFSSVAKLWVTLCDPMDCSTPGFLVHYQLSELAQTHVHPVSDAIQPSHLLSSHSPPVPNPSQHRRSLHR